ncbi:hypothetical protein [Paenibacillus sp. J31TS4]|uniref:hypothetical protein n=1 Tax=Paenibacillus sp. J31TS4 TaxID=2807195 RepID=UPI001BCE6D54|nr:hypothetical protein [Paenibacillus sp. J31TS4]
MEFDSLLYRVLALLVVVTVHGYVQAAIAGMLGDRTARQRGRASLNPLRHVAPLGLLMTLFGPYGYGQPVPIDPAALGGRRSRAAFLIYGSGALAYLVLAVLLGWASYGMAGWGSHASMTWIETLAKGLVDYGFQMTVYLVFLNLLPLYPLDMALWLRARRPDAGESLLPSVDKWSQLVLVLLLALPLGERMLQPLFLWVSRLLLSVYSI